MEKTPHPKRSSALGDGAGLKEQIERLAHALWEARGCPVGSPEEDWFRAEAEVRRKSETVAGRRPLSSETSRDRAVPGRSATRTS